MTDFTITIDDQDALDAISAAAGQQTPEKYLSDFCTAEHLQIRRRQLQTAAQAKAQIDPDVLAFQKRQTDKQPQAATKPVT